MWRHATFHIVIVVLLALAVFFLIRVRSAASASVEATRVSEGHRLAEAWCESCHAVEPHLLEMPGEPPSFRAIANQPGITPLALKVFFRTSHKDMPNLIISRDQTDAVISYILSLRTR